MGVIASGKALAILTGLVACALFWSPALAQESEGTPLRVPVVRGIEMLKVGDRAPEFEVEMLGGDRYRLADDIGKRAVLLTFWSVFCETCREEMPLIQRLHEEYEDKGLRVLGINLDGAPMSEAITYFAKKENMNFPVLIDELKGDVFEIADPYGVAGTPTTYILDKAGDVRLAEVGKVAYEDLENVVLSALSPGGTVHRVRSGEYLMMLSVRYYGTHLHWRRIFEANKDQIQDPSLIYPGQVLQIPQD